MPLVNLMRSLAETMGVRLDELFSDGAHAGTIREQS
jgi:hypothetical protein